MSNLTTSEAGLAMTIYSAFELDLEIVFCFIDFQLIGEFPNMRTYLVTILRAFGQATHSYKLSLIFHCKMMPCPQV